VEHIKGQQFERVGEILKISLCAVDIDGLADPVNRVTTVSSQCHLPLILMGTDPDKMKLSVDALKDQRPLVYRAQGDTADAFIQIAADQKVPLAVAAGSLKELAQLTQRAKEKGVEDLILSFDGQLAGKTFRELTLSRRAALVKNFKPLGYPAMVAMDGYSAENESLYASLFAVKYASIVVMNDHQPWQLLPVFTAIQDIYTDPQVPNMVDAKLYEIGSVNENSPILFTTNFALTYFSVAGEVERSRIPSYVCVVDTEGMGVLNAHAGDKISPEKVVKTLEELKAADRVNHRRLIIPGLLPFFRAELEDISRWKEVIIGPKTAREIPAFLNRVWN
jgi:acetyl-CoA decarbonylase/synthase complex subunit gamma